MMKRILLIVFALQVMLLVDAQSPNTFNFQAVIRDGNGKVIANTSESVQIDILQGSSTGTVVYSESQPAKTDRFGLINLAVGSGSVLAGAFNTINWATGPYYIKISVGGTALGTSQILTVPFSLYADKAGNDFSRKYSDLTNVPSSFPLSWTTITGMPTFATVFTSGSYNDLTNKPTLFSGWSMLKGTPTTLAGYGITDFSITSPLTNQLLEYNGTKWVNYTPNFYKQQLTLSANRLTLTSGSGVSFNGWDRDTTLALTSSGAQTVTGNKTFSGILTASQAIVASNGVNAGSHAITNVALPGNATAQYMVNKHYVDSFTTLYDTLYAKYTRILEHLIKDYDGNYYSTVTIGTQTWMAQNLKTTHFNDGTAILTSLLKDTVLDPATSPEFQWPANDSMKYLYPYGRLYTWFAANDAKGVCPAGYKLPSESDFKILISFVENGNPGTAGDLLKTPGYKYWMDSVNLPGINGNNGTNQFGFNWVGNGNRYSNCFNCDPNDFLQFGCLCTSSTSAADPTVGIHVHAIAWASDLAIDSASYHPKSMSYGIRCLKN